MVASWQRTVGLRRSASAKDRDRHSISMDVPCEGGKALPKIIWQLALGIAAAEENHEYRPDFYQSLAMQTAGEFEILSLVVGRSSSSDRSTNEIQACMNLWAWHNLGFAKISYPLAGPAWAIDRALYRK
jgi:hypothetical protein